jgi:hypothetical protein
VMRDLSNKQSFWQLPPGLQFRVETSR